MKEERSRVKRALGVAGDAVFALVLLFCICAAAVLLCLRGEGLAGAKLGIVLLVLLPCAVMLVLLSRELVCILLEPPERTFYRKSFTARLILAPSEVKSRYLAVKNELLSYRDCRARTSWKAESFRVRGKPFAKLDIRGRTLKLCLALPPEQAAERKYGIEDGSARAAFRDFPSIMRIRSARAVNYAKQLITLAALFHGFERSENPAPALLPPEMTRRQMLRAGLLRRTTMRRPFPSKEPR